jgi:hypothetical protein
VSGEPGLGPRATGLWVLVLLGAIASPLAAQRIRWELGPQAYALAGDRDAFGGGVYGAWRPAGRTRISLFAGAGNGDDTTVGRTETLVHFLLSPTRRKGAGVYAAGGVGVDFTTDATASWVVATLGVEGAPGGPSGWMVEAGVGGGWRAALGWRWRGR